jgi:two-component system sensor histidine kinase AlgZ
MIKKTEKNNESDFFLPDFCQTQSVFLVLLVAQFFAILFCLIDFSPEASFWQLLGFYSTSVQIVTLTSISILCLLRHFLNNYRDWFVGLISLFIILTVTFLFSLIVICYYWQLTLDITQMEQWYLIVRNLLISGIIGSVALRYFYLQSQYRKQLALQSSAKLQALQARIRPHFLFNSMNVIASLTRIDPRKAESAIEDLSDLFRVILENKDDLISFDEELKNSERYLAIEQLRLGERLKISKTIHPESKMVLLPPLSLQPLLENAVYHGIQMLPEGGCVDITTAFDNNDLVISVKNPRSEQANHAGHGMALRNITQRLKFIYMGKANLTKEMGEKDYIVTMRIPKDLPQK